MAKLNDLARDVPRLIDNAATASQNVSLADDIVTREAITLNVAAPLICALSEAEDKLEKARRALRFYEDPFDYINLHGLDEQVPDFYDEWDFGDRARATLKEIGDDNG